MLLRVLYESQTISHNCIQKKYYNQIEDMKGKVRVYCRARPLSKTELGRGNFSVVQSPDEYTVKINTTNRGLKEFNFDAVYTENNSQVRVLEKVRIS